MTSKNNLTKAILQKISQQTTKNKAGLLDGLAGQSLYYFYRNEVLNDEVTYDKAVSMIQEVIEIMSNNAIHSCFYNGIAGIGWMISHLNETDIVAIDVEDFLDTPVEAFLYNDMVKYLNAHVYDFFFGATGICFYFVNRYALTQNKVLKEKYKTYITHFLFYMEYIGFTDTNGIYWKHNQYPFEDDGVSYQLSAATNISAVMMVLVEIASLKDFNPVCTPLLERSSNWLLHKLETTQNVRIDEAFSLWKVGNSLNSIEVTEKALQLLKDTTNHLSKENAVSLSKFAIIYQKIAQETSDNFFSDKAKECFQIVSERFSKENFKDIGIWKGSSGIGLIDFSLKYNLNIAWANCMLI